MENEWSSFGQYVRIGLAGAVFVLLLVGGGAAALTALAAGLNALSGGSAAVARQVAQTQAQAAAQTPVQQPQPLPQSQPQRQTAQANPSSTPVLTVSSPIGDAIDSGGVVIGNHVQATFGRVLSHVLQTLFMEQAGPSNQGGAP